MDLLNQIKETFIRNPFLIGDSATQTAKERFKEFNKKIKKVERMMITWSQLQNVEEPFTLIIDDPLSNSYVQNIFYPEPDPQLEIETYERTFEQNEEWGLNDINTYNYLGDIENPEQVYGPSNPATDTNIPELNRPKGYKPWEHENETPSNNESDLPDLEEW